MYIAHCCQNENLNSVLNKEILDPLKIQENLEGTSDIQLILYFLPDVRMRIVFGLFLSAPVHDVINYVKKCLKTSKN